MIIKGDMQLPQFYFETSPNCNKYPFISPTSIFHSFPENKHCTLRVNQKVTLCEALKKFTNKDCHMSKKRHS